MAYRSLSPQERARFDPMITGFNPADMYAADHIKRVLRTFPGVFEGIGEFTIHKEFVSAKVAGGAASLINPALDRILDLADDGGTRRVDSQRHGHAVRETRHRARVSPPDEVPAAAASGRYDHLGPHRPGTRGASHRAIGIGPRGRAQPDVRR